MKKAFPFAVVVRLAPACALVGCSEEPKVAPIAPAARENPGWQAVAKDLPAALLSVSGTSERDVWAVGADKGDGPLVLHYDGSAWEKRSTGQHADLWWVHAVMGGPVFMSGAAATVLRYQGGSFERMKTPGVGRDTVYGVWAETPTNVYAVGGWSGHNGFLWNYDGATWKNVRLPSDMPRLPDGEVPGLFKVWGTSADDVWVVGGAGAILHGGRNGFRVVPAPTKDTLFTVHGANGLLAAVGGGSTGILCESQHAGPLSERTPETSPLLQGIFLTERGGVATGERATVFERGVSGGWQKVDHGQELGVQSLHAVWVDATGGVWSVGGNVLSPALDKGVMLHRGTQVAPLSTPALDGGTDASAVPVCPTEVAHAASDKSVARQWDEQILATIRRDLPRPPVHARNLYHFASALWDAWATYDRVADGRFFTEKNVALDVASARRESMSYAAYRVLRKRYEKAVGGALSVACYDAVMRRLGYDPTDARAEGPEPRAVGNRIAQAILDATLGDGSNEADNYADPTYTPPNPPLVMDQVGIPRGTNPELWQPLNLAVAATQNGIILPAGVQTYVGSQWNHVTPFAMTRASSDVPWHDPGPVPKMGPEMKTWVLDVLKKGSLLDPANKAAIDISPGAYGNNPLGANGGAGHPENPVTKAPYAPNVVLLSDFGRVLAEYWADGPKSETPPGHWNALANAVTDAPSFDRKLFGVGVSLDPLEWDVKLYFALNGALHDAACTAWDIKRRYQAGRPSTYIRAMGAMGQSSEPGAPAYHADGLPLASGLVEVITQESAAPGQRHEHLAPYVGQIAVYNWRSEPGDRKTELGGVGWIRATEWFPYQRRNFVTPPFPGFISGHSTYSRSAAEVLALLTGSAFFPGGKGEATLAPGYLSFESGPSAPVRLEWGTYYDAADQAGQSRIWGGIHIEPDDFVGRRLGSQVGKDAVAHARTFFRGTAR